MSGLQHGSAAGIDPPADAPAGACGLHGPAHQPATAPRPPGLVDLAAVTIAGVHAGEPPVTRRTTTGSPNPLLDAERERHINGAWRRRSGVVYPPITLDGMVVGKRGSLGKVSPFAGAALAQPS